MAINPEPPVPGLINYDYRHGADFLPPAHLIKRGPTRGVDPSMVPEIQVDTTYDEDEILANQPVPRVLPVFLGLRTALANRRIERANNRLQDVSKLHRVARHVGHSILAGRSYMDAQTAGQPNLNRPSTRKELHTARKLDKISTRRRRAGSRVYATSRSSIAPVSASRAERKNARRNAREHDSTKANISKYDDRFRSVIRNPAKKADRVTARRDRAVAKREALDYAAERRAAKIRQMRDELTGSARALGQEIAEQHQDSLDLTKEQAERLRINAVRSGRLAVQGTVALTKFYKEVGQNAGNLYWQGGKYVARQTAKHTSRASAKVKSKVRSRKSERNDR